MWWLNSSVYSHIVWTEPFVLGFLLKNDFMYVCLWLCICTCMPSWCGNMESNWLSDSHFVKLDFEQPTCKNYASFFFFPETWNQHVDGEIYSLGITLGSPAVEPRQSQKWMSHSLQWRIHVKTDIKKASLVWKLTERKFLQPMLFGGLERTLSR